MMPDEAWCKACWARWTAWYMRAGGVWYDAAGFRCTTDVRKMECPCPNCVRQRDLQHGVDVAEDAVRAAFLQR